MTTTTVSRVAVSRVAVSRVAQWKAAYAAARLDDEAGRACHASAGVKLVDSDRERDSARALIHLVWHVGGYGCGGTTMCGQRYSLLTMTGSMYLYSMRIVIAMLKGREGVTVCEQCKSALGVGL